MMRRSPLVPIVMIMVLMAVSRLLRGDFSSIGDWLVSQLMYLPGIIIAISFHEFGHAAVSYKLGDPTPEKQGRLTLNPLAHVDPVGLACLFFCGFGWGIPVQIDPTYYRDRKAGEIMVGFAGVAMNLVLAIVFSILIRVLSMFSDVFGTTIWTILFQILYNTVAINVVLMVFNLIPIPPLDGFGIATQLFNLEKYSWYQTIYNYGYFILIFAILVGLVSAILNPLVQGIMILLGNTILGI